LIQSLAVAVTAATTVGAGSAAAAGQTGFKAISVNHISCQVEDYAKTRDFYSDLFSMPVVQDNGSQCFLTFGNSFLIPRNHSGNTPRIDHIAYAIDNWDKDAVEAELKRRGLQREPDTENSLHAEDPNGFDLLAIRIHRTFVFCELQPILLPACGD
jgi:catechol 2,3-dioxygenase-like lactoylglutathione lyase family enzyme